MIDHEKRVHQHFADSARLKQEAAAVLAPHIGSAERDTREKMASLAATNVIAIVHGQPPLTPVNA